MGIFAYIFKTWALAQMLHPPLFVIFLACIDALDMGILVAGIFFLFVFSCFASLPSLFVIWLLFYIISNAGMSAGEKFIAWMVAGVSTVVLNFFLLMFWFGDLPDLQSFEISLPAIVAAVFSIVIRARSFFAFQLNYKSNQV